jgi:hypothetical protein
MTFYYVEFFPDKEQFSLMTKHSTKNDDKQINKSGVGRCK